MQIVDETGLLACAMDIDLNPVRAAIAASPEQCLHTSAYSQIHCEKGQWIDSAASDFVGVTPLETPIDADAIPNLSFQNF